MEEPQNAPLLVRAKDIGRTVTGVVIGREHNPTRIEVVGNLRVDGVDLVSDHQRLHSFTAANVTPTPQPDTTTE
jgi:hypothetical protein